jgi:hypothetical protein
MFTYNNKTGAKTVKKLTYYFKVGEKEFKVKAETAGDAMQWMNRNVNRSNRWITRPSRIIGC